MARRKGRAAAVPKYLRISQDIVRRVRSGELGPGARVESEFEMMVKYDVSNTTARRALREAELGGWVTRRQGKGTFASPSRVERSVDRILGFTRNMQEAGREPATLLLGAEVKEGDVSLVVGGRTYVLKGPYCEIERLRLADGVPIMKETRNISLELCPGIDGKDLERSLYWTYENDYGLQLSEVAQVLSAVVLEGEDLAVFGLEEPVPAFVVRGATFCGKEVVLETEESIYRGDRYQFTVKATRGPSGITIPPEGE